MVVTESFIGDADVRCDNFKYAYNLFATQLSESIYQAGLGNVMNSWGDCSDTSVVWGSGNDENNEDNRLDYCNPCWSADLLLDYAIQNFVNYDINASGFVLTRSARVSSVMLVSLTLAQLTVTNFAYLTYRYAAPKLAMTHYTYCAVLVVHDVGICCVVSRHDDTTFTVFPFDKIGNIATTSRYVVNVWTLVWTVRCFAKHRKLIDLYQMGGDTEHHVSGLLHWFSVTFQHDDIVSQQMVSQLFASEDDTRVSGTASAMIEYGGEATLDLCSMPSDEKVAAYLCVDTSDETVQLCLPMISEIPATDNMKVTPMDYMGNVNFQYSADGDSSTIPPTYMEDDFAAAAEETNTTTTKRWNMMMYCRILLADLIGWSLGLPCHPTLGVHDLPICADADPFHLRC